MVSRKKPSKLRRRIRKIILSVILMIGVLVFLFEFSVKRQLAAVIIEKMKEIVEVSVAEAVEDFLTDHRELTEELSDLHISSSGVEAITTDSYKINLLKTGISHLSQQYIDRSASENGIDVPLLSLSGLVILSECGPNIHLKVGSQQTIHCDLTSTFSSGGINQTVHHISLIVSSEVTVYNPYRIKEIIKSETSFEIAQSVIVGSVPSYSGVVTY